VGFGEDELDLFAVEFGIVVAQFGGLEVFEDDRTDFGADGGQAAGEVFVGLVVGGDVEGRCVSVIEVVEVGVDVAHAVHNQTRQLQGCGLYGSFSIVQQSEVSDRDGSILIFVGDEGDLDVVGEKAEFALDIFCDVLLQGIHTVEGTCTKISKWLLLMALIWLLARKLWSPSLKDLKENLTWCALMPASM
jgi:hypothetical protein